MIFSVGLGNPTARGPIDNIVGFGELLGLLQHLPLPGFEPSPLQKPLHRKQRS